MKYYSELVSAREHRKHIPKKKKRKSPVLGQMTRMTSDKACGNVGRALRLLPEHKLNLLMTVVEQYNSKIKYSKLEFLEREITNFR